jgi:hypothetical protein
LANAQFGPEETMIWPMSSTGHKPSGGQMKIEASQVSYFTAHRSESATEVIDETNTRRPASTIQAQANLRDTVKLSGAGGPSAAIGDDELNDMDPKLRLAWLVIESLLGRKLGLRRVGSTVVAPGRGVAASVGAPAGTVELHRRIEVHSEMEQTKFQAQGVVETADGRRIRFSVGLNMERNFSSVSATEGTANTTDPLVVNFGGGPARIASAKIAFDLNSDGKPEAVSFVASGSGFLALDRNGDGKVNDGGELFGPATGNGFAELAAFDVDGNGWIDESDPVFAKLRVWTLDGVSTLTENGIGAIAAASLETPFALKDSSNVLQANVRATGIYLAESGAAGTIQQVDLAEG